MRKLNDRRRRDWFWAYNNIFDKGLSANAIAVYCLLCKMCGDNGKEVCPSQEYIGKILNLGRNSVINALKELDKKVMIHKEYREGKGGGRLTNGYTVLDDRGL